MERPSLRIVKNCYGPSLRIVKNCYGLVIEVTNPQTTTAYNDPWTFTAYKDSTPNHIIDTATVPGFPINAAAPAFAYMTPNSVNALARQLLEFNMSFPMDVVIGDMIQIDFVNLLTQFCNRLIGGLDRFFNRILQSSNGIARLTNCIFCY